MNADELMGKMIMVGLSRVNAEGRRVAQTQVHGRVMRWSEQEGLVLELSDGTEYHLPPDLSGIQPAPIGTFTENSSGATVENPDYLVMWELHQSLADPSAASWQKGPIINFPNAG